MSGWTRSAPDVLAARRAAYDALRDAGVADAPRALPPLSARDVPTPDVLWRATLPGGWSLPRVLRRGEALRLTTPDGTAAAALVAWNANDPSERLNTADTVKVQWTTALRRGRVLFGDMGRVMLSITEDSSGRHDALIGPSVDGLRSGRSNLLLAAMKFGLDARDIPPCVTFFAPVAVDDGGRFVWTAGRTPGDFVELRAEMDVWLALSNTRHPLDPEPGPPGALELAIVRARVGPDDACRTATAEARRGFDNNADYQT